MDVTAEGTRPAPTSDHLLVSRRDGVVIATLNRPRSRNALTFAMYDGLAAIAAAASAEGAKALIVTGAGTDAFAAGTDIAQFDDFHSDGDALAYEARVEALLTTLEGCPVPTIAAIAGACTGGGAAIAAACDVRIGAENLAFGFPIARTLGNCLSAANLARLVALVGEARTKDMIFTARLIPAQEARAIGLISEIVPEPRDVLARAEALAQAMAGLAPLTLRATKDALRRLRPPPPTFDDLLLSCYRSHDFREGIAAFAAKRSPRWEGR